MQGLGLQRVSGSNIQAKGNSMSDEVKMQENKQKKSGEVSRRDFIKYTAGTAACISLGSLNYGCGSSSSSSAQIAGYPIDSKVVKTSERMISFPYTPASAAPSPGTMPDPPDPLYSPNGKSALKWNQLYRIADYDSLGYGKWSYVDWPLPVVQRTDIMPSGYSAALVTKKTRLLNFFAMTDIHLTDKEAPNQLIYLQQSLPGFAGQNSSIYSGVMLYTPQVFDAAIQTANALHRKDPFDFFISLGDVCNTSMYNELRWYLDIIDGKVITPSSGAHDGADSIDYQKPFKAAGLDKSIPFYQALGNHDHFMIGSFPISETAGLAESYVSDTVWSVSNDLLTPVTLTQPALFPANINNTRLNDSNDRYYQGVIDGTTPLGTIKFAGTLATAPKVVADPNRRSLPRTDWIQEFFKTTTSPVGHGFNLVTSNPNFGLVPAADRAGFACYSFVPKASVPLKVIVLDDTQREDDGSLDIHGHGFLDAARWNWLKAELADGQAANQLMIIACHIPICVSNVGTELEWWLGDSNATITNACTITELVTTLQNSTNLLMWIAGHRHVNTVKAFQPPAIGGVPENGFWQVESSSLRDFPQQFRTFEIFINSDYSISIEAVNVDIAVKEGTPAATSRKYAIATQQILQNPLKGNPPNYATYYGNDFGPIDPTRVQGGDIAVAHSGDAYTDPSIQFVDLTLQGVPYNASYNAQLFKQLSPAMKAHLQTLYPTL
ncbi:metallophosphoesterase [Trichlorobacter lovleyi SZ]|uniref:Metallophosphoesterase n=2 Tax=Trichlorobacter lovleyi TaxID=313985 RepID=B3E2T5_TRIL1|nr:metallophosphoesterase [Trichlorobacter lovleyi SZ]